MAKILTIEETTFSAGKWPDYDGFVITTDSGDVKVGIANFQSCCETWGYVISNDNLAEFTGAGLLSVVVVDEALEHVEVPVSYEGSCMFININTSVGTLQFVAYNNHNGYYSHDAVVIENGIVTHSESL
jgi:hypothetical protein